MGNCCGPRAGDEKASVIAEEEKVKLGLESDGRSGTTGETEAEKARTAASKAGPHQCIFKERAKLYRYRDDQWKERGVGNARILRDNSNKKIYFLMRQEKTMKPIANFILGDKPFCELVPHPSFKDTAYMFSAIDFSEEAVE